MFFVWVCSSSFSCLCVMMIPIPNKGWHNKNVCHFQKRWDWNTICNLGGDMYEVKRITRSDCAELILEVHYAKRWPSITHAFGLFRDGALVGCVTYGTPPSATLRTGVAGKNNASRVIELNRLVLRDNLRNEASMLVGRSLRMLPKGLFVVSFADTEQGHKGFVYQACNFRYYGLSAKRTDWKIKGLEHLHGQTVSDEFRGKPNRARLMREKYGDDFYLKDRPRKHRYIYCTKGASYDDILYEQQQFPK